MRSATRSCSRVPWRSSGRVFAPVVGLLERVTNAITGALGVSVADRDRISSEELMILVERGGEQGIIEAEEEQMIGAVLGLGERKVHEVMVPRIDIVGLPVDGDPRPDGGHHRAGRALAHPGVPGQRRQHRGHPVRQGPAAVPQGHRPAAAGAAHGARAAVRARVDERGRPAPPACSGAGCTSRSCSTSTAAPRAS